MPADLAPGRSSGTPRANAVSIFLSRAVSYHTSIARRAVRQPGPIVDVSLDPRPIDPLDPETMKILVATDGSRPALRAVRYAAKLVGQLSSTSSSITLVSVHDDVALRHAKAFVGHDAIADYLRGLSEKELKPARRLLASAGVRHDMEVRTGHVSQEIVDCAKSGRFDLIVLGAKGRSALSDLLLGSVAQRVLATAEIPVLLVK
jgi:nucleotide-binding universal stress UspA family protein